MSVRDLLVRIRGDSSSFQSSMSRVTKGLDDVAGKAAKAGSAGSLLGTALGGVGLMGVGFMAERAISAGIEMVQMGAQADQLRGRLDELAAGAGGSADAMIEAIKRASAGTVAEFDIVLAANKGIMLGLGANAEQWEQLSEVARYRAQAMGISMTQALDDISTGIGRESRMILDNLGIILDLDSVMNQYAGTLGKTADELTATERKQALLASVIQEGQTQIQAAGGITDSAAEAMQRYQASVDNLKESIGTGLAPAMGTLATALYGVSEALQGNRGSIADIAKEAGNAGPQFSALAGYIPKVTSAMEAGMDEAQRYSLQIHNVGVEAAIAGEALKTYAAAGTARKSYLDDRKDTSGWSTREQIYAAELARAEQDAADKKAAAEEIANANEEAARRSRQAWEDSLAAQQTAWEDLRGTVRSALSATSVTQGDMDASAMGTYVEKWDEDARRLDAIAARGFEEIKAHADWAGALKIPPEVLAGSEAALKEWASRTSVDVRALARPDLLTDNMDAMVQQVKDYMARQQAIELTVDMVASRVAAEGGQMSKEQVAEALGLTVPEIPVSFGVPEGTKNDLLAAITGAKEGSEAKALSVPLAFTAVDAAGKEVELTETGGGLADTLLSGLKTGLYEFDATGTLSGAILQDVAKNGQTLKDAGELLWHAVEPGIRKALKATSWVEEFAWHMAPYVADVLKARGDI